MRGIKYLIICFLIVQGCKKEPSIQRNSILDNGYYSFYASDDKGGRMWKHYLVQGDMFRTVDQITDSVCFDTMAGYITHNGIEYKIPYLHFLTGSSKDKCDFANSFSGGEDYAIIHFTKIDLSKDSNRKTMLNGNFYINYRDSIYNFRGQFTLTRIK